MKFIPRFADLCEPLRKLLKADAVWNLSASCQTSFDELKLRVSQRPVLAHFDSSWPTFITCDASAVALCALLSQHQGGEERLIAFASRTLSPSERNYSASEREVLHGLPLGVRTLAFLRRQFTLRTDHQTLKTLLSSLVRRFRSSSSASASVGGPLISVQFFRCLLNESLQHGRRLSLTCILHGRGNTGCTSEV